MSLIHDALRKAAEENARREGRPLPKARHEMPTAPPPAPARSRGWLRAAAVALVALALAVAFWPSSPAPRIPQTPIAPVDRADADKRLAPVETAPVETPAAAADRAVADKRLAPVEKIETEAAVEPAAPAPALATIAEPIADTRLAPVPAPPPASDTRLAPVAAPVAPTPAPPTDTRLAPVSTPPIEPAPAPATAAGAPRIIQPPPVVGQVAADTYVLHAEIDGQKLDLDFIVWSADEPFAQVNGRQVAVGQQVDGFVVVAISREQITLEKPGRQVRLRIR